MARSSVAGRAFERRSYTADGSAQTFAVPDMDRGSGIVVGPGGHHAFVTGWYDAHLYRVGFEGTGGHPEPSAVEPEAPAPASA